MSWFLDGIKMDRDSFEVLCEELRNMIVLEYPRCFPENSNTDRNGPAIDRIINENIDKLLKTWAYAFFNRGSGYNGYEVFLRRDVMDIEEDQYPWKRFRRHFRECLLRNHVPSGIDLESWFYMNCWMVSGGEGETVERGRTSAMARLFVTAVKDEDAIDPSLYSKKNEMFFRRMLQSPECNATFCNVLRFVRNEDPEVDEAYSRFIANYGGNALIAISGAYQRFRNDSVFARVGWYLSVNGNQAEVILGVERIVYPEVSQEIINGASLEIVVGSGTRPNTVLSRPLCGGVSKYFTFREVVEKIPDGTFRIVIRLGEITYGLGEEEDLRPADLLAPLRGGMPVLFGDTQTIGGTWCPFCDSGEMRGNYMWVVYSGDWRGSYHCPPNYVPLKGMPQLKCRRVSTEVGSDFLWGGERVVSIVERDRSHRISCSTKQESVMLYVDGWVSFTNGDLVLGSESPTEWARTETTDEVRVEDGRCTISPSDRSAISTFVVRAENGRNIRVLFVPEEILLEWVAGRASEGTGWKFRLLLGKTHRDIQMRLANAPLGRLEINGRQLLLYARF